MATSVKGSAPAVPPVIPERDDLPEIHRERFRIPPMSAAERDARRMLDELATSEDVETVPEGGLVVRREEVVEPVPSTRQSGTWD